MRLRDLRRLAEDQARDPSFSRLLEILKECARHGLPFSAVNQDFRELEHECRMERIFKEARNLSWWIRHTVSVEELAGSGGYLMPAQATRFMALAMPSTSILRNTSFARADHVHESPPHMVSDQVFQDWRAMVTGQVVHSPAPEEEADDEHP